MYFLNWLRLLSALYPMIEAKVLADSVGPNGVRLTTLELTYPRFIHSEVMTHRMFSRNAASSRAIPTERMIEQVRTNPFIPVFHKRVTGMGIGEELEGWDQVKAREIWVTASIRAAQSAEDLLHVDKSRANRLLEPFVWMTTIVSATEWENFFALRTDESAQMELRALAFKMRDAMDLSVPRLKEYGEWHLPLVDDDELENDSFNWRLVSIGRVAKVSYNRHHEHDPAKDEARAHKLIKDFHLSPTEHVATPLQFPISWNLHVPEFIGNFRGWKQYRKLIPNEWNYQRELDRIAA